MSAIETEMPHEVTPLSVCLSRQSDRRQMGVVAYDRRPEDANFGEHLAHLTPGEQVRLAACGLGVIIVGGLGFLVVIEGLRQLTGVLLHVSQWL